jgi:hypothetical protein
MLRLRFQLKGVFDITRILSGLGVCQRGAIRRSIRLSAYEVAKLGQDHNLGPIQELASTRKTW